MKGHCSSYTHVSPYKTASRLAHRQARLPLRTARPPTFWAILILLSISHPLPAETTPKAPTPYEALVHSLTSETTVHWIEKPLPFPLLIRQNQSTKKRGTAIIIPTSGHHGNWPGLIRHLRAELAKTGWNTASVSLSTEDPERIANTYRYVFQNLEGPYIIIAEGDSASTALDQLEQQDLTKTTTTVLINAKHSETLNQLMLKHKQFIIELVSADNPGANAALLRSTHMSQNRSNNHFMKIVPGAHPNFEHEEERVSKTIRGILTRMMGP